jgi:TRAP-type C4-dicarboxylate transport system permease small subunit
MIARIDKWIGVFASVLLFLLMMLTVVDVTGRSLLNQPLTGASELTEITLACIVFLLLPQIARDQKHITVDLIGSVASRQVQAALDLVSGLTGCFVFSVIAWQMWGLAERAAGYGDATPSLGLPLAPVLILLAIMSFLTALGFLATILKVFRRKAHVTDDASPIII